MSIAKHVVKNGVVWEKAADASLVPSAVSKCWIQTSGRRMVPANKQLSACRPAVAKQRKQRPSSTLRTYSLY